MLGILSERNYVIRRRLSEGDKLNIGIKTFISLVGVLLLCLKISDLNNKDDNGKVVVIICRNVLI